MRYENSFHLPLEMISMMETHLRTNSWLHRFYDSSGAIPFEMEAEELRYQNRSDDQAPMTVLDHGNKVFCYQMTSHSN
mgnify:CR=1 FL=1